MNLAWELVTLYLDVPSVLRLSEVNKQLHRGCQRDALWIGFMMVDFPEHVVPACGQYHRWYKDLYQYGAYYARQERRISVQQAPICIFLPLSDDEYVMATFRSKPVFQSRSKDFDSSVYTLRHAGERYLLWIGKTHDLDMTGTVWWESSTTPNHTLEQNHNKNLRKVILGTDMYAFFDHPGRRVVRVARLSPFRHAKTVGRAVKWLHDHFELYYMSFQVPNYVAAEYSLADSFCIIFSGWLKKGNLLSPGEQKTPFTYDHNYDGGWCRHFDQEAQTYCEKPINMQYTTCVKHPPNDEMIRDWSLDDQTDRDTEASELAFFYLRPGFITSYPDGDPNYYAVMNGELIPTFDK